MLSLLRWWSGSKRSPQSRRRLGLEHLEDRAVPASYTAATVPELITAIQAANVSAEADTITLTAGTTYTLTAVNNATNGATGLPTIAAGGALTILGNGSTIERSVAAGTPAFRLFDVAVGAALTLEDLTLQGGLAAGSGVAAMGGAIYSQGALTLNRVTVQNNQAVGSDGSAAWYTFYRGGISIFPATNGSPAAGGGVYIAGGTAELTDVTLASNVARGGKGGDGASVPGGVLERERYHRFNIPSANGGAGLGGALYAAGGTISLHNTAVTLNSALGGAAGKGVDGIAGQGVGGGLYIEADVAAVLDALTLSQFKRNKASTSDANVAGPYLNG